VVSDLLRHCLRSVLEFPLCLSGVFPFVAAEPRESCLCTRRYVYSGQELAEQVLVPGIVPLVVSDLLRHCLRSVLEFPLCLSGVFPFVAAEPRESCLGTSRYVYSGQELAEQVLLLGIVPPVVSDLLRHCLRLVLEFPLCLSGVFPFVAAEPRESCLGTSRYVYSGQELAEQVLVPGMVPLVVSDLLRHCLRSVLEFPPLLFRRLHVCGGGTTRERPRYQQVRLLGSGTGGTGPCA